MGDNAPMIRRNVPVKIPPAPPQATTKPTYKKVTVGVPVPAAPPKPERGKSRPTLVAPSTSTFFLAGNTLSNVEVRFEEEEWEEETGEGNGFDGTLYENITRAGTFGQTSASDSEETTVEIIVEADQHSPQNEILYENLSNTINQTGEPGAEETDVQYDETNALMRRGTYEILYIPDKTYLSKTATYEAPEELFRYRKATGQPDKSSSLEPPVDRHSMERLSRSAPTSPVLNTVRRAPLPPPSAHFLETIYKDPASLFDEAQHRRFTGAAKSTLHHPLQGTDFSIQDSGSDATINDSGSGSDFTNSFEDFVVRRRKATESPKKTRAISEILNPRIILCPDSRSRAATGVFEMFKKSMFGAPTPAAAQAQPPRPRSTFYVSHESSDPDEDEAIYHSLESLPAATSRSTFYTDQEEHIYSTSETLGPLDYPEIAVENLGYRSPKVRAVEEHETRIPVKTGRSETELSADSFHSIPDTSSDLEDAASNVQLQSTKRRLTRVSLMRKNGDGEVRRRDKAESDRTCQLRKAIVSMQFSSDVLEIADVDTET